MERTVALDRVEELVEAVESEPMPVPVREVWVYGDVALGLDPIDRLDVYLTKDMLMRKDGAAHRAADSRSGQSVARSATANGAAEPPRSPRRDADREAAFRDSHGVKGVGKTVDADWAAAHPEHLRTNPSGHAAPEKCLAAHLLDGDEPVHLEVCNSGFEDNVTQRLRGARMRENYEQILDPRGVCLWVDGQRSESAFEKLRNGDLVFPTLANALEMLGMEPEEAETAADAVRAYRERQEGTTVRGDVV